MGNNSKIRKFWLKITVYGSIPQGGGGTLMKISGNVQNAPKLLEKIWKKWVKIFFPKPCLYYISTKCARITPKCFSMDFYGHLKH
jgi:hypothetical protein